MTAKVRVAVSWKWQGDMEASPSSMACRKTAASSQAVLCFSCMDQSLVPSSRWLRVLLWSAVSLPAMVSHSWPRSWGGIDSGSVDCTGHYCCPGNRSELKLASSRGQDAIRHVFSKEMQDRQGLQQHSSAPRRHHPAQWANGGADVGQGSGVAAHPAATGSGPPG